MPTSRYTQQHFRDFAALLAAEREQNGPSPALNRITAAITQLFAENSARFNRELFGQAARGNVPATAKPRRKPQSGVRAQDRPGWDEAVAKAGARSDRSESSQPDTRAQDHPRLRDFSAEANGWTPPVVIPVDERDDLSAILQLLNPLEDQS